MFNGTESLSLPARPAGGRGEQRRSNPDRIGRSFAALALISFLLCLNLGCAKSVTPIVDYGDQMRVEITLGGTVDTVANRYFMVFSSIPPSPPYVPLPQPDNPAHYEMVEPDPNSGVPPIKEGTLTQAYYDNFYSFWSSYIILQPNSYYVVKGPFTLGQNVTREAFASLDQTSNVLSFNITLDRLFNGSVPNLIYFDVVTVPWVNGQEKLPADHIDITNLYISKVFGSSVSLSDSDRSAPGSTSLDIINCKVTIQ